MPSWVDQVLAENQAWRLRNIEEEFAQTALEQRQMQLEMLKQRQSAIAEILDRLRPQWYTGETPVDVGEFQGRQVAVGPQGVRPFETSGAEFRGPSPTQAEEGKALQRQHLGLPIQLPSEKATAEFSKMAEMLRMQSTLEEQRETGREKRQAVTEAGKEKRAEAERIRRDVAQLQTILETAQRTARTQVQRKREQITKSPEWLMLQAYPAEQTAILEELEKEEMNLINDAVENALIYAKNFGIPFTAPSKKEYAGKPGALTADEIEYYKALSLKDRRIVQQQYRKRFGRPFPKIREPKD